MTRVAVVGLGLIGGSAALAFAAPSWDRDFEARRRAAARGIDARNSLEQALEGAEVVLLAVSSAEVAEALSEAARLAPSAILTDAASWKRPAVEAAARLPAGVRYVGGHPMAGATASGAAAARADLFAGRPWLLVPTVRSDDASVEALAALARSIGALPRVVDAAAHDAAMTWASHLPLAVASALARTVSRCGGGAGAFAGPGLLDTTRLASTPSSLALELALADPVRLADALDEVAQEISGLSAALRAGDETSVRRYFEEASEARQALPSPDPQIIRSPD